MKTLQFGRKTEQTNYGESRSFIAPDGSTIRLQPGRGGFSVAWSTEEPAKLAIKRVIEREVAEQEPYDCIIFLGPEKPYKANRHHDWREVSKKFSDLADNDPDRLNYVRFDFPTRSFALCSMQPRIHTLGISAMIRRYGGKQSPADVESLRRAFQDTAADSIKAELDWVLEALPS